MRTVKEWERLLQLTVCLSLTMTPWLPRCSQSKCHSRGWLEVTSPLPFPNTPAFCFTFQMTGAADLGHIWLLSIWGTEAGGLLVEGQPGLQSQTLSQKGRKNI